MLNGHSVPARAPKEFSGGAPRSAHFFAPFGESNFAHEVHPVVEPDFAQFDSPEGAIRELIAADKPVQPYLDHVFAQQKREAQVEVLRAAIGLISRSRKPRLVVDQLNWISGASLLQGVSAARLARRHSISKQAFCQGGMQLAGELNMRPAQAMRDGQAKATFSWSNFRRNNQ